MFDTARFGILQLRLTPAVVWRLPGVNEELKLESRFFKVVVALNFLLQFNAEVVLHDVKLTVGLVKNGQKIDRC